MEEYANTDQVLWRSKSSGHKAIALLLSSSALMVLSIAIGLILNEKKLFAATIVFMAFSLLFIVGSLILCVMVLRSELRWEVSNLLFTLADSGFYFTAVNRPDTYFYAQWSEIDSYSYTVCKNGKINVTVNFDSPADAGSYGKIKRVKMIGVTNVDLLNEIFSKFGVRLDASKN